MKTPLNQTASESAPSKEDSTLPVSNQPDIDFNSSRSIAMQNPTTSKESATINSVGIDLKLLRLPADYGATLGIKKLLTNVSVGKPKKPQFFRTHASDEMTFPVTILENKEARESYVVVPEVAQEISELVYRVKLHVAIDRQNNVLLIPVPLPGEDGTRNPWHESLAQAVEHAKLQWIRITANMHVGGYDIYEAQGTLPDPEWPEHSIDDLIQVAFRGKIITDFEHPVVQALLGRI